MDLSMVGLVKLITMKNKKKRNLDDARKKSGTVEASRVLEGTRGERCETWSDEDE